jgi:hypothetical protein
MTTPIVTEIKRSLEPVGRDAFAEPAVTPTAAAAPLASVTRLPGPHAARRLVLAA